MTWERRRGAEGLYYTHTTTVGGRRKRMYIGKAGDPVAEYAAANEAIHKICLELDRREFEEALNRLRNGPLIAGIEVATAELGRLFATGDTRPTPPDLPDGMPLEDDCLD